MTAAAVLAECDRLGVVLRADGDLIRFRPRSAVDDDLLAAIRERKPELLEYLSTGIGVARPPAPHRRCPSCGGGLQPGDDDLGLCGTCLWFAERFAPRRPQ